MPDFVRWIIIYNFILHQVRLPGSLIKKIRLTIYNLQFDSNELKEDVINNLSKKEVAAPGVSAISKTNRINAASTNASAEVINTFKFPTNTARFSKNSVECFSSQTRWSTSELKPIVATQSTTTALYTKPVRYHLRSIQKQGKFRQEQS